MTIEIRQDVAKVIFVRMVDASDLPVTGLMTADVTIYWSSGSTSPASVNATAEEGTWEEPDVTNMPGVYSFQATDGIDVAGSLVYSVTAAGCKPATVYADVVAALASDIAITLGASVAVKLDKLLGLSYSNAVYDTTVYDADGNLTSVRVRSYDSRANAIAAGATGLLYTHTMTSTYASGLRATVRGVLEP